MFIELKDFIRQLRVKLLHVEAVCRGQALSVKDWGKVVIIAPHPDDEVLGCGGLIARLVQQGNPLHVVILTRGEHSHAGCCQTSEEAICKGRHQLTLQALQLLGLPLTHLHTLAFEDGKVSAANRSEMQKLSALLQEFAPDQVLVPHWGEGWNDHVQVKSMITPLIPARTHLYEYCVWMWYYNVWKLDWKQARLLRMSKEEHALKQQASVAYVEPLAPCGKPWSGVLPNVFLKATQWDKELFFKIR